MHISFHLGAHYTDEDQLIRSLLKNGGAMTQEGIALPGPGRYRGLMADVLVKLDGARADAETQEMLFEAFVDNEDAKRLVLGHKNFLGAPHRALEHGQFYHLAKRNTQRLRYLFCDHTVSFFIGMRNPATFVPSVLSALSDAQRNAIMAQLDPRALFWSDILLAIRESNPETQITVWCDEDTPLIWSDVMHAVSGIAPETPLEGSLDILEKITHPDGMKRLTDYLQANPIQNEGQRRRILTAFLDKYAIDSELEMEIDLPGWSDQLVDDLTATYDQDMDRISHIPGVTLLTA